MSEPQQEPAPEQTGKRSAGSPASDDARAITSLAEEVLTKLPELGGEHDLENIRTLFDSVDRDTAVQALAHALTLEPAAKLRQERENALKRLGVVAEVHGHLCEFATAIGAQENNLGSLLNTTLMLGTTSMVVQRLQYGSATNDVVGHFDQISSKLCDQAGFMLALVQAGKRYHSSANKVYDELKATDSLQRKEALLTTLEEHMGGFTGLINSFESRLREFPHFCREMTENIRQHITQITTMYCPEPAKQDEDDAPRSIMDLFRGSGPQRLDVPVYRGNPLLTAYLHELAQMIPTLDDEQRESKKRVTRHPEVKYFVENVQHNADPVVIAYMKQRGHYECVAEALTALHSAFQGGYLALKTSNIREALRDTKLHPAAIYSRIVESVQDQLPGKGSSLKLFEDLSLRETIEYLSTVSTIKGKPEAGLEGPKKRISRYDQAYLDLFEQLDEMTSMLASNQAGQIEVEEFVKKVLALEEKTGDQRERRQSTEMRQAVDSNNYAFTVVQGDHGALSLDRVPTGAHRFTDLIGESWMRVEETVDTLLDYSTYQGLYTHMTQRGKINNNAIIAGPPGCGKNMFLRVLQSDPRLISINMSTDRVMSMWHGRSEGNIRDLFELTYEKRVRLDKPAVIGWDEVDALFGQRKSGGVTTGTSEIAFRMQKILQSVLEGDTFYEGVAMIGFTNEPQHIPASVFRRFANVVVVEPLTDRERQTLLENYLEGVPLADGFQTLASWDEYLAKTQHAHGDVIGKIFDQIYLEYIADIKLEAPEKALAINAAIVERYESGERIDQATRRALFVEHVPDRLITPELFHTAFTKVLAKKDVQGAMKSQETFYENINARLGEAFDD